MIVSAPIDPVIVSSPAPPSSVSLPIPPAKVLVEGRTDQAFDHSDS